MDEIVRAVTRALTSKVGPAVENRMHVRHQGTGVWELECLAHEKPIATTFVSNRERSRAKARQHIDEVHPGEAFVIETHHPRNSSSKYTGAAR